MPSLSDGFEKKKFKAMEDAKKEAEWKEAKRTLLKLIPNELLLAAYILPIAALIAIGWVVLRFLWNHLAISITVGVVLLLFFAFCGAYMEEKKGKKAKTNENGKQK